MREASLVAAGALLPAFVLYYGGRDSIVALDDVLSVLAGLGSVAAGIAALVYWKLSGQAVSAWLGTLFAAWGLLYLAYSRLGVGGPLGLDPWGALVPCAVAPAALVGALRSPEVDARLIPTRLLAVVGTGGLCIMGLVALFTRASAAPRYATLLAACVVGVVWVGLSLTVLVARRRLSTLVPTWVSLCFLLLGLGQIPLAVLNGTPWGAAFANFIFFAASALALTATSWDLRRAIRSTDHYSLRLSTTVDDLRREIERERTTLDGQLHDLRNAVSGIRTAHMTLRHYEDRLDGTTRETLTNALTSELSRLQVLIEPGRTLKSEPFVVSGALEAVLATSAAAGTPVMAELGEVAAMGNPAALAQAVQNILAHARRHAPGSPVSITAQQISDRVIIRIADEGPGIPPEERQAILEGSMGESDVQRRRASTGPDSRLGLSVAVRLMTEMGGTIRLDDVDRGACFVLDLPAAAPGDETQSGDPSRSKMYSRP